MAKASLKDVSKELNKPKVTHSKKQPKLVSQDIGNPNPPKGSRGDFFKTTISLPGEMLAAVKLVSIKRRTAGMKGCDTSSLIREAIAKFLADEGHAC